MGSLLFGVTSVFSQTTPLQTIPAATQHPGLFGTFEQLVQIDDEKYKNKINLLAKNPKNLIDVKDPKAVDIDPDFLNSVILHTPSGYLNLGARDKCSFYDLILTDLARSSEGKIQRIMVRYENNKGQVESAVALKKDFIEKVIFPTCPDRKNLVAQFQIKTLDATIKSMNFTPPNGREQCEVLFNNWLEDNRSAYFCQIHELIQEADEIESANKISSQPNPRQAEENRQKVSVARILRTKLSESQRDFIGNFCGRIDDPKLFCDSFFTVNFWARVLDGTKPASYLQSMCQETLGKKTWSNLVMRECINKLKQDTSACFYSQQTSSGLSPRPNCEHLSMALNHGALFADYDDCSNHIDHHAITNMSRVLRHTDRIAPTDFKGFCSAATVATVYRFNEEFDNESFWNSSFCFDDKIEAQEICLPVMMGDSGDLSINLSKVVARILYRTKGAEENLQCKVVPNSLFNPNMLEYKSGCFIVVNQDNCGVADCDMKIWYNEREMTHIKRKNQLTFDYFPSSFKDEKFSQTYVFQRDAKRKSRSIINLTALVAFFKQQPNGIIHGIGCAEDLLPAYFKKQSFNQCSPLPFIVDGMIREGEKVVLISRSAVDEVNAPRLISWSSVYSSLKNYQFLHPLHQWMFYGVY